MEILSTIWTALTTPNEILIKCLGVPLIFIETTVTMLLFTSVLNIQASRKNKIIYIIIASLFGTLCGFIPKPYSNIVTIIGMIAVIMVIFKVGFFKSLIGEFIPLVCITICELFLTRLTLLVWKVPYEISAMIPLYRVILTCTIYFIIFLLYKLVQHFHFNITLLDNLNKRNKGVIIANVIFAMITIFIQFYLIRFYNDNLPSFVVILSIISLSAYFFISFYSLTKTMKLETTTRDLEESKLYNKTLQILHDNMRAFRHDFSNIVAGIGGYAETNDMEGLRNYYHQLLEDCQRVNNLTALSPESINNPAIYNILANKYHKADELGIKINLDVFIDLNTIHMKIYEFTRILGILMDNAIEATSECEDKIINVIIRKEEKQHRQILLIENTYQNKDIDTDKIYEKGFSTKKGNTGLGLWEVRQILKKRNNLNLYTYKNEQLFSQQLEIYY